MALDPNVPDQAVRLRALHARRGRSAARRRVAGHRQLPDPPGRRPRRLRRQRAALAAARPSGNVDDRHRAGADQRLVPAVPEPLDRHARVRRRRRALRQRRRRRELQLRRLRPGRRSRRTRAATRPVPVGGTQTPPTAEGGALRSQDLRTPGDPVGARRLDHPRRPRDRRARARQPARRQRRPQRAPDRRLRAAQPVPHHRRGPAPTSCGSATSAGTTGRRSTASPTPTARRSRTSAGPATKASRKQPGYDALNLNICEHAVRDAGDAITAVLHLQATATSVVPGDGCPTGSSSITGGAFYPRPAAPTRRSTTARSSSPTTRASCIWAMLQGANGAARPDAGRDVRDRTAGAYSPVDLVDRAGRRPLLRRPRRRDDPAHPLLRGQPTADRGARRQPDQRRRAAHRELRRAAARPTPTATR